MKSPVSLKKEKEYILALFNKLNFKDLLPILILPVVATIVFLLPLAWQELLKLSIKDPQIWQFYSSSFVHQSYSHFKYNILNFIIISVLLIILALRSNFLKSLNKVWIISLIAMPFIISFSDLTGSFISGPNLISSCGSSGLVAVFIGFIPVIFIKAVCPNIKKRFHIMYLFLLIIVIYLALIYSKEIYFFIGLPMILIIYTSYIRNDLKRIWDDYMTPIKESLFIYTILTLTIVLFFILPYNLFPKTILIGDTQINFFTHYIGIIFGVLISFIYFELEDNGYILDFKKIILKN